MSIRKMNDGVKLFINEDDLKQERKVTATWDHEGEEMDVWIVATYESGSLMQVIEEVLAGVQEVKNGQ